MTQLIGQGGQKNASFTFWDTNQQYRTDDMVVYNNEIYLANGNIAAGAAWDPAQWTLVLGGNVSTPTTVAALGTQPSGARAFVNDAELVAAGNFGAVITGSGANTVPVWSNGTSWYIG